MQPVNISLVTVFAKEIELKLSRIELLSEHCEKEIGDMIREKCIDGPKRVEHIIKIMSDETERQKTVAKQEDLI